jgi:hypothetical protein
LNFAARDTNACWSAASTATPTATQSRAQGRSALEIGLLIANFVNGIDRFDIASRNDRHHLADGASQVFGGHVLHWTASRNQRSPISLSQTARGRQGAPPSRRRICQNASASYASSGPAGGQTDKLLAFFESAILGRGNVMLRKILRSLGLGAITRHERFYAFAAIVVLLLVWLYLLLR